MNSKYWDNEGAAKTFTHGLSDEWINGIPRDMNVLDLGCGYGRITRKMFSYGFKNVLGYDPSKAMISRAVLENPGPRYTSDIEEITKQHYSLVICFALFTSCPEPDRQMEIKELIEKQTDNASCLYISDYLTSENPHYSKRYEQRELGLYGCFGTRGTVIFRHHQSDHFTKLFSGWKQIESRTVAGKTLNGNKINISQLLFEKV